MPNQLVNDVLLLRQAGAAFEKMSDEELKKSINLVRGWTGKIAHPNSPSGGAGPGHSKSAVSIGSGQGLVLASAGLHQNTPTTSSQSKSLYVALAANKPISFTVSSKTNLPAIRDEYQHLYDAAVIQAGNIKEISDAVDLVRSGKNRYSTASERCGGGIPWYFIGIMHHMEADCDFSRHLHNGDPLSKAGANGDLIWSRTVREPKNRPTVWPAPSNELDPWVWSTIDAISVKGFTTEKDWSIPAMLYRFEQYNGMGYRKYHNIPSPYLWSGSQIYSHGKYVKDGKYDDKAISHQIGAALVLKDIVSKIG